MDKENEEIQVPLGALCSLLMCSDPWPVYNAGEGDGRDQLVAFADAVARDQGFQGWLDAFHRTGVAYAATLRQQAGRVDEGYAQDLRHLIYLDTQFGWRGETDLKLLEMQALEARGWIAEGEDNGEYAVTDEGERVIEAALSASPLMFADNGDDIERRMAYDAANACPHCGGSGHKDDALAQPTQAGEAVAFIPPPTPADLPAQNKSVASVVISHAERARVPDDMVLVPREPTPEMRAAFRADSEALTYYTHTTLQCADFDSRYRAMLGAAAPSQRAEVK
jgi:hypothetical protein